MSSDIPVASASFRGSRVTVVGIAVYDIEHLPALLLLCVVMSMTNMMPEQWVILPSWFASHTWPAVLNAFHLLGNLLWQY